ncbi:MAG: hypothetical protein KAJ86_04660 [Alphaproteobacteria bacterium]|nr:hypothetical protein [Alphaproteobacteria bacterium]
MDFNILFLNLKTQLKHLKLLTFALTAFFVCAVSTANAACTNPDGVAGEINYNVNAGVMQYCNDTDWINMGKGDVIDDITNPVGVINPMNSVNSVWEDGTYIYVTDYYDGLFAYTFDGTTLTQKAHVDTYYARGVWGDGTYIYVANSTYGIRAYTFDGTNFTLKGSFNTPGTAQDIWGDGTYIYVADYGSGVRAYTFDGTTFTEEGYFDTPGNAHDVWGDGTYIYVADYDSVRAYSFDGTTFTEEGNESTYSSVGAVWGDGTYIYVTDGMNAANKVHVYTFNGTTFTEKSALTSGTNNFNRVWGDGTYIYITRGYLGIYAYTFDGTTFTEKGSLDTPGSAYNVWGDGTYIYITDGSRGLRTYSFDGTTFTELAISNDPDVAESSNIVFSDGTYVYTATPYNDINAWTFDGTNFTLAGNYNGMGFSRAIWSDGNYIYVGGSWDIRAVTFDGTTFTELDDLNSNSIDVIWGDGTYIYTIDTDLKAFTFDGTTLTEVGTLAVSGRDIWGDGTYIYVSEFDNGLHAYTFDGTNFTNVGTFVTPHNHYVWGDETYIYTSDWSNRLLYVLTFDGTTFTELDNINLTYGRPIWSKGEYIYAGNRVVSFDGTNLTYIDNLATESADPKSIYGDDNYVYVADSSGGLRAYNQVGGTCSAPNGAAGEMHYNFPEGLMQYCNGTAWIAMGTKIDDGGSQINVNALSPDDLTKDLVGHWPLDDGTGSSTAADNAQSNDGTLINMDAANDWVAGEVGEALDFDGDNDQVEISGNLILGKAEASICFWMYYTGGVIARDYTPVAHFQGGYHGWKVYIDDIAGTTGHTDTISFLPNSLSSTVIEGSDNLVKQNEWMHVCTTFKGSTFIRLYIDGELDTEVTASVPNTIVSYAGGPLKLGNERWDGKEFQGRLDDVRIYDRALSENEVQTIYNKINSLAGHWKLNESTGTSVADSAGTNTGTWSGEAAITSSTGKSGGAITFDGINDTIEIPDDNAIDFDTNDDFSVSAWIKTPSAVQNDLTSTQNSIIEKWDGGVSGYPFIIRYVNTTKKIIGARYDGTNYTEVVSTGTQDTDTFQHYAFVKDGGTLKLYINGSLNDSIADGSVATTVNNSPLCISKKCTIGEYFTGEVDDIRIYDRALSLAEVESLYSATGGIYKADCSGLGDVQYTDTNSGHCYYLETTATNWAAAQGACQANGDYLAVVTTQAEQDIMENFGSSGAWLGGKDDLIEGEWRWKGGMLDGVQFWQGDNTGSTTNGLDAFWKEDMSEPDNSGGNEHCLQLDGLVKWNDATCGSNFTYICEKEPTSGICTSPDGVAGEMVYNVDHTVMQYCNGSQWIGIK